MADSATTSTSTTTSANNSTVEGAVSSNVDTNTTADVSQTGVKTTLNLHTAGSTSGRTTETSPDEVDPMDVDHSGLKRPTNKSTNSSQPNANKHLKKWNSKNSSQTKSFKDTSIGQALNNKKDELSRDFKGRTKNIRDSYESASSFINSFKNQKGFKNKAKFLGNKFKDTDTAKKIEETITKIQRIANVIASYAYPILIVTAIVLLLYVGSMFIISISQGISETPHYYCDTEASASLKRTDVYKQYCTKNGFVLENLNGHYLVQDGSGPCLCCAYGNLLMRYYASFDYNVFDYLWGEDGRYSPDGQMLEVSGVGVNTTWRHATNRNLVSRCRDSNAGSAKYGAKNFAIEHGKSSWRMSNWGYLRDDSLDIDYWDDSMEYYESNYNNEHWVWDLSIDSNGPGSDWNATVSGDVKIDGLICRTVCTTIENGDKIKELFSNPDVMSDAGIILYYKHGSSAHAILLTGYDEEYGWICIDSAQGLYGGYEGPLTNSNFAWNGNAIEALLDDPDGSIVYGGKEYGIKTVTYATTALFW